jgi:hypothetical protein
MEKFITVTMVLLILSMITEKIGNFLKMSEVSWIKSWMKTNKSEDRERKIQTLSMLTGTAVALVAKANIFEIYSGHAEFEFFWSRSDFEQGYTHVASSIIGSLFCGMFLSLGSKFFHDLLDMLLQVKNLKRKLVSKEDIKLNTIEEYDRYLADIEPESMNQFLDSYLRVFKNISTYELDYDAMTVNVVLKDIEAGLPGMIPFKSAGGSVKMILVNPILLQ